MSVWRSVPVLLSAVCLGCPQGGAPAPPKELPFSQAPKTRDRLRVAPADLAKVEPAIEKEPAYQSKAPRYGLLVFGPEADTRVWLVLDGDRLYIDRNGNGDLTEPGECLDKKPRPTTAS